METETAQTELAQAGSRTIPRLQRFASAFEVAVPLAIIVLGIILLQCNSLRFWDMAVGPWIGWGWSILLELISLWLWYRPESGVIARWIWRVVALTTTGLLLTGPLYQVSAPLYVEAATEQAVDQKIARAERSLERYQDNSRLRAGWQGKIDQTEAELARLWSERWKRGNENGADTIVRLNWQRRAVIVLQLLSVLLVQAAIVLAIATVSAHAHARIAQTHRLETVGGDADSRHDPKSQDSPAAIHSRLDATQLVLSLQDAVRRRRAAGQSYADIAQQTGIPKPYLSLLMNHFERLKRGDRVLKEEALRKLAARFDLIGDDSAKTAAETRQRKF